MGKVWGLALAAAAMVVAAAPVNARTITTDTGDGGTWHGIDSPGCTLDGSFACTAISLGFSADFGSGMTNKLYLYDDGMVSFGAPAPSGFGPGTVAAVLRSGTQIEASNGAGNTYQVGLFERSADSFTVHWNVCGSYDRYLTGCNYDEVGLNITKNAAAGNVTISLFSDGFDDYYAPISGREAQFGYNLGTQQLALSDLTDGSTFTVTLAQTANAPEPATWALSIVGFGAIGAAMRRRNNGLALAA